jgi:hypothetical protein
MSVTNVNAAFFVEKKHEKRKKELVGSLKTYQKFHAELLKRKDRAMREFSKEENHILGKIKELEEQIQLTGALNE